MVCAGCKRRAVAADGTTVSLPGGGGCDFGGLRAAYVWQNIFSRSFFKF